MPEADPQGPSAAGCGTWLAWFLAVAAFRYVADHQLGWSTRAQALVVIAALVVTVVVLAVRSAHRAGNVDK